jgi:hypothetical protein
VRASHGRAPRAQATALCVLSVTLCRDVSVAPTPTPSPCSPHPWTAWRRERYSLCGISCFFARHLWAGSVSDTRECVGVPWRVLCSDHSVCARVLLLASPPPTPPFLQRGWRGGGGGDNPLCDHVFSLYARSREREASVKRGGGAASMPCKTQVVIRLDDSPPTQVPRGWLPVGEKRARARFDLAISRTLSHTITSLLPRGDVHARLCRRET